MSQSDNQLYGSGLAIIHPNRNRNKGMQKLDELLQDVNCQIDSLHNLLKKINSVKGELHCMHGSLMHTAKRERTAFIALSADKDNIVGDICNTIVKAERHTVIQAKIGDGVPQITKY